MGRHCELEHRAEEGKLGEEKVAGCPEQEFDQSVNGEVCVGGRVSETEGTEA